MKIYTVNNVKECLYHFAFRNEYDVITNEICRDLFQAVINNNSSFSKSYPEHGMDIEAVIERLDTEYIEKVTNLRFVNFDISADNAGVFYDEKFDVCTINIKIVISNDFSEQDYQRLNYTLYEVVRHEIEHKNTFCELGNPKQDYTDIFERTFKSTNFISHCKDISTYILHPQELPSYAKSVYFYAKKSGKDFQDVVDSVLMRSFFNNDPNRVKLGMENSEISSLLKLTKERIISQINLLFPKSITRMTFL